MKNKNISRRSFVKNSALGAGAVGIINPVAGSGQVNTTKRLPREVFVAGFSSDGLRTETSKEMIDQVENELKPVLPLQPDIICLPETFPFYWGINKTMTVPEQAEFSEDVIKRFSAFAKQNNTWLICPVITSESGKYYNAAVLIDRSGKYSGEYRKMHPTDGEMLDGISPGPSEPPVFETDFGKIGIQICFDIQWNDGWEKLSKKGTEIIFWPSAFTGGFLLNARAWQHKAAIVSSPLRAEAKICDITGEDISKSGYWQKNWVCSSINLEKAFIHTWPYINRFPEIQKKYGQKIRINHFHNEEFAVIESLSEDVKVKHVLEEFEIRTHTQHIEIADKMQKQARNEGIESLKKS